MPRDITFPDETVLSVATEEELLEFVNKVREAGGANVLEALMPSYQHVGSSCLIARGLNFGCNVFHKNLVPKNGGHHWNWAMELPHATSGEALAEISKAFDTEPYYTCSGLPRFDLPEHIGNAAAAFDEGLAFQEYAL